MEESVKKAPNGVDISKEAAKVLDENVGGGDWYDRQIKAAEAQMDQVRKQSLANAAAWAGAREKLRAQSAQMNSLVAELVALVGGSCDVAGVGHLSISDVVFHAIADGGGSVS